MQEKEALAERLYEELADRLKKMGNLNLYACIGYPQVEDDPDKNSAEFHAHLGFELVGTFHNCGLQIRPLVRYGLDGKNSLASRTRDSRQ